jgi:type I restriction enzyme, S subunit
MPDTRLPSLWEECRLGDVVDYGATQKTEPGEIPADAWVLELEDIEKDTSKVLQRVTFAQRQSKSTKNRFAAGDVLYGKLRPYLNKVVRADQDGYCSTEIVPLSPSAAIDGGYLFYWLKHPAFLEYVTSVSHGLNMPRLGTEAGKEAPFVLAPINEQKRIADKLDAVLAQVDACRERLDRIPAMLKRFLQAVLTAATSGKLTEEWREERQRSEEWQILRLAEVGEIGRGKSKHRPRNDPRLYGGPYPFIQTGDIAQSGGRITTHTQTYSEFGLAQSKLWQAGTVCITIAANIADTAILEYPACFPDSVVGFVADPKKSLPEFIKWSIDVISDRLEAFAPATA